MEVPLLCGPRGLMNVKPHQFSELGDLGASPLGGIHNNWGTYVWISSFQGEVGDLVLQLEQAEGRHQGMCQLALIDYWGKCSQLPYVGRLEARALGNSWENMHSNHFGEKLADGLFCPVPVLSPGWQLRGECLRDRLTTSLFAIILGDSYECKPHCLSVIGNLGAHPSHGSCKSWGTRCMDKLLLGWSWKFGFIVGMSQLGKLAQVPTDFFGLPGRLQTVLRCMLIGNLTFRQQLKKYIVKFLQGKTGNVGGFGFGFGFGFVCLSVVCFARSFCAEPWEDSCGERSCAH